MSRPGLRFTEVMSGHVAFGERDYRRAATAGRVAANGVRVRLTIEIDDLDRFAADADRTAEITGWVEWEAVGGRLPVERGVFNLLVGATGADHREMRYRLWFRDGVGHPVTLAGEKLVGAPSLRVWSDTTTLYVRALRGHMAVEEEEGADLIATGILRLSPVAFARQLTSFRATGRSRIARVGAIGRFDALFAGHLWHAYRPPIWRRVRAAWPATRHWLTRRRPASGGPGDGAV